MSEEEARREEERKEEERKEAERQEEARKAAEGAGGGGGEELATALEEAERLREENAALADQNRELLGSLSEEGDIGAELAEERTARQALEKRVEGMDRERTVERERAAILKEQPELAEHLDLIGEDDPEKMRERAAKLKKFGEDRLAASRTAVEKEVAAKYGVPLGSSAEGAVAPEEKEARKKAIDSGDAATVAGQIVEKDLDKLL